MRKVIFVVLMLFCLFGCTQNPVSVKNENLSELLTTVSSNILGGSHLRVSKQNQAPIVAFRLVLFDNTAGKNHIFTIVAIILCLVFVRCFTGWISLALGAFCMAVAYNSFKDVIFLTDKEIEEKTKF
jgi:hypothetical protein